VPLFHRFEDGGGLVREASGPIRLKEGFLAQAIRFVADCPAFATLDVVHIPLFS